MKLQEVCLFVRTLLTLSGRTNLLQIGGEKVLLDSVNLLVSCLMFWM